MKVASAYDIPSKRVFTREELKEAIAEMLGNGRSVPARSLRGGRRQCFADDSSGWFSKPDVAGVHRRS